MSGVRLSNGSPTLERTDSRVTEHPKPSACRNLFGSVDHGQLNKDFNAHMREQEEAAAAKWDFDFVNDTPLANNNSRFKWELVNSSELPEFYNRQPRRETGACSGNNNVDLNGNHHCVLMAPSEDTGRSDGQTECTGLRKRPACHGTTFLSDYMEQIDCYGHAVGFSLHKLTVKQTAHRYLFKLGFYYFFILLTKDVSLSDPSTQNKRSHTSSPDEVTSSLSHSVEHTPRKLSPKRQT